MRNTDAFFPGAAPQPSANMAEHIARSKKNWDDFGSLKDGEKKMLILPAFDFFHVDPNHPDRKYGQHGASLVFAKRKGRKAVSVEFYTGWSVDNKPLLDNSGENISFMCTGTYTHYRYKKDASEYAYKHDDCPYTGSHCYGEAGSALYGDVILKRLVFEGSVGVWDEIEQELDRNDNPNI
jgi:hypothetical protein